MKFPFGTISITEESKKIIKNILNSQRLSAGKYVRKFEEAFSESLGVREAVAVSSGTDAVALSLACLYDFGATRGDEVILPALTFIGTANAVLQAGFKPVFVDIKRETLNIDVAEIEKVLTNKTRAIIAVHLMGKPADMDEINKIAKKHKLFVIEDAAEAYGTMYKGKKIGTLGDLSAFSLYVAHVITTVEGGIIGTDREDFAEVLRSLRAHGRACKCKICILNTVSGYCPQRFKYKGEDIRFVFERVGFSAKMNELEAAIGLGNIGIYSKILEKRRKNLKYLMEKFKRFEGYFTTIKEESSEVIGPHAFPVVLREGVKFKRDKFVNFLEKRGIETRTLFSSIPTQSKGYKFLGYKLGEFPNAEYIGENGLHIGVHQGLNKRHLDYFLNTVEEFILKNK
ncbi:MAG TPA: DegT/DnrJ/EryC1/StrS family aminotransferase [Candidatus Omnitrophica bacterium]|nr:DegT/DnrJ/EryC1/StrS family aminotransferase [Candidatus Omnitrophota bacterium]